MKTQLEIAMFFFPREIKHKYYYELVGTQKLKEIAEKAMQIFSRLLIEKYPDYFESKPGIGQSDHKIRIDNPEMFRSWLFNQCLFFSDFYKFVESTGLMIAPEQMLIKHMHYKNKQIYAPFTKATLSKFMVEAKKFAIIECYSEKDDFFNCYASENTANNKVSPKKNLKEKSDPVTKKRPDFNSEIEDEASFQPEKTNKKSATKAELSKKKAEADLIVKLKMPKAMKRKEVVEEVEEPLEKPTRKRYSRDPDNALLNPEEKSVMTPAKLIPKSFEEEVKIYSALTQSQRTNEEFFARQKEEYMELQQKTLRFKANYSELTRDNIQLKRQVETLERQKAAALRHVADAEYREEGLESDLTRIRGEKEDLKAENQQISKQLYDLTQQIMLLQQQLQVALQQPSLSPQTSATMFNNASNPPQVITLPQQGSWSAAMFKSDKISLEDGHRGEPRFPANQQTKSETKGPQK